MIWLYFLGLAVVLVLVVGLGAWLMDRDLEGY